jgi:SOS-response transcriptional repressor LexA
MRAEEKWAKWLDDALTAFGRGGVAKLGRETSLTQDKVSKSRKGDRRLRPQEMIEISECLGVPLPEAFDRAAEREARAPASRRAGGRARIFEVPLLSHVSAAKLAEAMETPPGDEMLTLAGLPGGDYFALTVRDDSMDRFSPDQSIIIVNRRERNPLPGRAYVFSVRGEATYKIWQPKPARLEPWSTNPANKPIFVERKRDLIVIGRVRRTILDL